jgi:F-type H+-transporting ATPase subunit delta
LASNRTDALLIARRYATAIFAQALEAKSESKVVAEFEALAEAVRGNAALAKALSSPLVSRAEKTGTLAALAASANALTKRALAVIAEAGRAELVAEISDMLSAQLRAHNGEVVAVVTSARPLAVAVQKQLKDVITKATGKTIEMELREDAALLGGLTVQLGSLKLDASLAGALTHMKAAMSAPTH